jgi:hypothetical protein
MGLLLGTTNPSEAPWKRTSRRSSEAKPLFRPHLDPAQQVRPHFQRSDGPFDW